MPTMDKDDKCISCDIHSVRPSKVMVCTLQAIRGTCLDVKRLCTQGPFTLSSMSDIFLFDDRIYYLLGVVIMILTIKIVLSYMSCRESLSWYVNNTTSQLPGYDSFRRPRLVHHRYFPAAIN